AFSELGNGCGANTAHLPQSFFINPAVNKKFKEFVIAKTHLHYLRDFSLSTFYINYFTSFRNPYRVPGINPLPKVSTTAPCFSYSREGIWSRFSIIISCPSS